MAPTICTEKESRVRRIRRRSSGSSVISYVGKITHRRSVTMRNASSKLASSRIWDKMTTCESDTNEESLQSITDLKGSIYSDLYDSSRSLSESSTNWDCSDRLASKTPDSGYRTPLGLDQQLYDKIEISSLQDVLTRNEDSSSCTSSLSMDCSQGSATIAACRKRKNSKGLLEIAIKTIKLIRRNQLLQQKLAQLQTQTRAFVESVMANPENRALRDKMDKSTHSD